MPKLKQLQTKANNPNLKDFLGSYSAVSLQAALNHLEFGDGWSLFKAYVDFVQRRYEVDALDMIGKEERDPRAAAYASGYAKACEEMKESFITGLRETILGKTAYENPRPEE